MRFQYTPEVSLGSLAQIATIIIGCFSIYVGLKVKDAEHDATLMVHTVAIDDIKKTSEMSKQEIKLDIKEINTNIKALDVKITESAILAAQQRQRVNAADAKRNP